MRASSCAQNWTNSRVGIVGNELPGGHRVLSFGRREAAQTGLLTAEDEGVLSGHCSPILLKQDVAMEPRMPGGTPAQSLAPGDSDRQSRDPRPWNALAAPWSVDECG